MRLLRVEGSNTVEFSEFFDKERTPAYAILSHRWSDDEISFRDAVRGKRKDSKGYQKLLKAYEIARSHGLEWLWMDSCCIDKSNSQELTESINSMFRWYQEAQACIAYLADVKVDADMWKSFRASTWFTRGWTLQELLAPSTVCFYDADWTHIADKRSLAHVIQEATGIPNRALLNEGSLVDFSVKERLIWASAREKSRVEDQSYSLLGIFGVSMPLIYGEGQRAFQRLLAEILEYSDDESIFAWAGNNPLEPALAPNPSSFGSLLKVEKPDNQDFGIINNGRDPLALTAAASHPSRSNLGSVSNGIPTDSGYASLHVKPNNPEVSGNIDRESILSGAATVDYDLDQKSRMIIAFINELRDRLDADLTIDSSYSGYIDESILAMMKSYTTELESLARSGTQRKVVRFFRQQRRRIARQVRASFGYPQISDSHSDHQDPTEYSSPQNVHGWMQSTDSSQPVDAEIDDSQEELDDVDHLIQEMTPFIIDNSSFKEFIKSLDSLLRRASSRSFQQLLEIMEAHVTPSDSTQCCVEFDVSWDMFKYCQDELDSQSPPDLLSTLTLTRSEDDDYQALTCLEYLEQTWPDTGPWMVSAVQKLFAQTSGGHESETMIGSVRASISTFGEWLIVSARGPKIALVEIGEQLAWLGAACRTSIDPEVLTHTTPIFTPRKFNKIEGTPGLKAFQIIFNHTPGEPLAGNTSCWRSMFRTMNVADGFPISRREHHQSGLEISSNVMAEIGDTHRVNIFDGCLVLKGFSSLFVATAQIVSSLMWHFCFQEATDRIPYTVATKFAQASTYDASRLESARHFVGWVDRSHQTTSRPQNKILEGRRLALNELTVSFSKAISGGANFVLCKTGRRVKVATEGPVELRVHKLRNWNAVIYDDVDRRAWLVDGASAVLHILRCQLDPSTEPYGKSALLKLDDFVHADTGGGSESAVATLCNQKNREMVLSWETKSWVEFTNGIPTNKKIQTPWRVEDLICTLWEVFELMHDALLPSQSDNSHQVKLRGTDRDILEGWSFREIADSEPHLRTRAAVLKSSGRGWVDFIRSINAVPLLGRGFGDIIAPHPDSICGPHWSTVPAGKDFLTTRISTLKQICSRWGDVDDHNARLAHNSHWHRADKLFAKCDCTDLSVSQKCDRVQVLLPKLVIGSKRHPGKDVLCDLAHKNAAVIFGRSRTWRWHWANTGDPVQDDGPSEDDDSGIGTSLSGGSRSTDRMIFAPISKETCTALLPLDVDDHHPASAKPHEFVS